jgi:hypothetical protein
MSLLENDFKIYFSETTEPFKRLGWSVHFIPNINP